MTSERHCTYVHTPTSERGKCLHLPETSCDEGMHTPTPTPDAVERVPILEDVKKVEPPQLMYTQVAVRYAILQGHAAGAADERMRCEYAGEVLLGRVKPHNDSKDWWDGYESCVYDYQREILEVK